jgi:hypothetical protein
MSKLSVGRNDERVTYTKSRIKLKIDFDDD